MLAAAEGSTPKVAQSLFSTAALGRPGPSNALIMVLIGCNPQCGGGGAECQCDRDGGRKVSWL